MSLSTAKIDFQSVLVIVKENASSAWRILLKQWLTSRSIWKWFTFFGSIFISSRIFFYYFYYPKMVSFVQPPASVASLFVNPESYSSNARNNTQKGKRLQRSESISRAIPNETRRRASVAPLFNKSIFDKSYRWRESVDAACRVTALINAILTTYRGFKIMRSLNLTGTFTTNLFRLFLFLFCFCVFAGVTKLKILLEIKTVILILLKKIR